jgi:hypothetical protein
VTEKHIINLDVDSSQFKFGLMSDVMQRRTIARMMKISHEFTTRNKGFPKCIMGYELLSIVSTAPIYGVNINIKNHQLTNPELMGNLMGIKIYLSYNEKLNEDKYIIYTDDEPIVALKNAFIVEERKEKLKKLWKI